VRACAGRSEGRGDGVGARAGGAWGMSETGAGKAFSSGLGLAARASPRGT
jgi:hypothetical protein